MKTLSSFSGDKKAVIKKNELGFSVRILKAKVSKGEVVWILLKFKAGIKNPETAEEWAEKHLK